MDKIAQAYELGIRKALQDAGLLKEGEGRLSKSIITPLIKNTGKPLDEILKEAPAKAVSKFKEMADEANKALGFGEAPAGFKRSVKPNFKAWWENPRERA